MNGMEPVKGRQEEVARPGPTAVQSPCPEKSNAFYVRVRPEGPAAPGPQSPFLKRYVAEAGGGGRKEPGFGEAPEPQALTPNF